MTPLPVVENCDSCGACCLYVAEVPFRPAKHQFDEALKRRMPAHLLAEYNQRVADGVAGGACPWLDADTKGCRHYTWRPAICRLFVMADDWCRAARREHGIAE